MSLEAGRILFCDYDGDFAFAEDLSRVGFIVDQIRPDALRQVGIGDHQVFVFSFGEAETLPKVLKTAEKLKFAELKTPMVLVARASMGPDFLNHQKSKFPADAYISNPLSEAVVLDALDELIGCPIPSHLKSARLFTNVESEEDRMIQGLKEKVQALEAQLKGQSDQAAQQERDALKPKLKALLEGQKLQFQTEAERLKVALSEIEAKLLDREAKIKDMSSQHEKAQATLREFYMNKLKQLEQEKRDLEKKTSES